MRGTLWVERRNDWGDVWLDLLVQEARRFLPLRYPVDGDAEGCRKLYEGLAGSSQFTEPCIMGP